jgi:hypothetical protein
MGSKSLATIADDLVEEEGQPSSFPLLRREIDFCGIAAGRKQVNQQECIAVLVTIHP